MDRVLFEIHVLSYPNPVPYFLTNLCSYMEDPFLALYLDCARNHFGLWLTGINSLCLTTIWEKDHASGKRYSGSQMFHKKGKGKQAAFISVTYLCTGISIHTHYAKSHWQLTGSHQETYQNALFCFYSAEVHPCFFSSEFQVEFNFYPEPHNKINSQNEYCSR